MESANLQSLFHTNQRDTKYVKFDENELEALTSFDAQRPQQETTETLSQHDRPCESSCLIFKV